MNGRMRVCWRALVLVVATAVVGCAAPGRSAAPAALPDQPSQAAAGSPGLKRITVSIMDDPPLLSSHLSAPSVRGIDALEELVHVGLVAVDRGGALHPRLAETIPSIENGLWQVFPDGRMQTTWKIKPAARWHDGTPLTAADLLFTITVGQDRELALFRDPAYDFLESAVAPDAQTLVMNWRRTYIEADVMFTRVLPLPKHLLERSLAADKATFDQLPYWSQEFVGAGPYRPREWVRGSHLILEAFAGYVLGRPAIDEIEVRFIPDPNTLTANVLAGTVDVTLGRGLDLEQGILVRDQWREGKLDVGPTNWLSLWPQFINPRPAALAELEFRRALLHAVDRQTLVDTFLSGFSSVAHSFIGPDEAEYRAFESRIVRYAYDPRRAVQLIEGLGYTRGPSGAFRDAAGQPLALEPRTTAGDLLREKVLFTVADDWQRVGVAAEASIVPRQRAQDQEYRATFPSFELVRQPNSQRGLASLHSRAARLPENNWVGVGGTNYARYANPEFDILIDRYFVTIARAERTRVLGDIVHHISDQLNTLGLVYMINPTLVANRVANVKSRGQNSTEAWNAHEWDVAPSPAMRP